MKPKSSSSDLHKGERRNSKRKRQQNQCGVGREGPGASWREGRAVSPYCKMLAVRSTEGGSLIDDCLLSNCKRTHTCVGYSSHCQDRQSTKANGGRGLRLTHSLQIWANRCRKATRLEHEESGPSALQSGSRNQKLCPL